MAKLHILLTFVISGVGLAIPTIYLMSRLANRDDSATRAFWAKLDSEEAYDRRRRRRNLGMAIMALVSVVFFIGSNYLNPRPQPTLALAFWIVLLLLLVWLCVLAVIDLAEVRRLQKRLLSATRGLLHEEMEQVNQERNDERREED